MWLGTAVMHLSTDGQLNTRPSFIAKVSQHKSAPNTCYLIWPILITLISETTRIEFWNYSLTCEMPLIAQSKYQVSAAAQSLTSWCRGIR